jgi:mannonate dehydratase
MSASIHVGLSTTNFAIQEFMGYDPLVSEVFRSSWTFADGYLHPGDRPGLGVEVDETAAAAFPYERAYLPVARNVDGSVKDW